MRLKLFQNKFTITFLVIFLTIFLHYTKILSPLERVISLVLSPFQGLVYSTSDKLSYKLSKLKVKKDWEAENQVLKQKINQLEEQIVKLKMFIEEQELVDKQNKYLESQGFKFVNARIISSSSEPNPNLLVINKGSGGGVKHGMAVVVEDGVVVGKIIKTEDKSSLLLLLIDSECRLSATLAGKSEIVGLVQGQHNISLGLDYILKNVPLKKEDLIITSGVDEHIPAGLLIGEVGEVVDDGNALFKSASIISPVNFKNLRIVSVVTN